MRGKIKRALAGLFVLLLALCLSAGLYVGLKGYGMYREALEQKPLAEMAEQVRAQPDFTPLDELPRLYRDAVVAVEDHRFYSHGGVDFIALCRALWNDVCAGAFVEGGSTITQQLAKNLYFTQEKVLTRKAAEAFMANLKLAQIATHVADARTCVLHPANATHRQMNDAELAAAGITPDLIRLSCGIEATEDLIADVDQALAAV